MCESETPTATGPRSADEVGVRTQHQAAALRRTAAAAAADVQAQLDADRPDQALPPCAFAAEVKKPPRWPLIAPYTAGPTDSPGTPAVSTR